MVRHLALALIPVYVVPAGPEFKLALGGLLQTQYEAGDVSAFEGRFWSAAIEDRFRLRRMRINAWSDFRESNPALGSDEFDEFILRLQVIY